MNRILTEGLDRLIKSNLNEEIIKPRESKYEPAVMKCDNCGTEFYLEDQYYGACECPKCG